MSKQDQDIVEQKARIKELEAILKEKEEKLAAGEEGAMQRVCKALDIDPDKIKPTDVVRKSPEPIVECFVHMPVRINQSIYQGKVRVPYSVYGVIAQALGDHRMRLLRELTGDIHVIEALAGGGFASKVVGKIDASGERIA